LATDSLLQNLRCIKTPRESKRRMNKRFAQSPA
jgi:hypothetical protein